MGSGADDHAPDAELPAYSPATPPADFGSEGAFASGCAGAYHVDLLPPHESWSAGTFRPGGTLRVRITAKPGLDSPGWVVTLRGTSELHSLNTIPSVHDIADSKVEVPSAAAMDEPIEVSLTIPMFSACPCRPGLPLPSSVYHIEPRLRSPQQLAASGGRDVGGGRRAGWISIDYILECRSMKKTLLKRSDSVSFPIVVFSPPFDPKDVLPIELALPSAQRNWRSSTLVEPNLGIRMPDRIVPLHSAKLEYQLTELPDTILITFRVSVFIAHPASDVGPPLGAILSPPKFSLLLARRLVPVVRGAIGSAPAAQLPMQGSTASKVELLREPPPEEQGQAGRTWTEAECLVVGSRVQGHCEVLKSELVVVKSCNAETRFYLIGHSESPAIVSTLTGSDAPTSFNIHTEIFTARR